MSLFEWLCEGRNPGPVGSIESGKFDIPERPKWLIIVRFIISIAIIGGIYYLANNHISTITFKTFGITTGVLIVYCVISFFVRQAPDTSNMGWAGGLIDNPLRISDDLNRNLVFLKIVLMPGLFIAESVLQQIKMLISIFSDT